MIDFSRCQIRTPQGADLQRLYDMLGDVFAVDRPVFAEMKAGKRFYTWTPYTLFRGHEILGNASLFPVRIRLAGRLTEVVGIASVATPEQYRRMGIAGRLLRHCLDLVDRQARPSVLFTDMPAVYEPLGFKVVPQVYLSTSPAPLNTLPSDSDVRIHDALADCDLDELAAVFADSPKYDGTVDRDADYWQLYRMLVNLYPKSKVVCSARDGRIAGYARIDVEPGRLLVCEICPRQSDPDAAKDLLRAIADTVRTFGRNLITFALPREHVAWQIFKQWNVPLMPEPVGAHREIFMVRPPASHPLGPMENLQWSLADKF